jgi:tetratricopeptide (TPR) repeat protein
MKYLASLSLLLLVAAPLPAAAKPAAPPAGAVSDADAHSALIVRAALLIRDKKPAEAIELLDWIIAAQEKAHAGETRRIYSSRGPEETLFYMLEAAGAKVEAVAVGSEWSDAVFFKGFALIDMGRHDEAGVLLKRAVELAPANSQFLAELGEWHKTRREWEPAYSWFEKAEDRSSFSPKHSKKLHRSRALRGMGFVLIEQGKLDEAEKMFRKCLEIDSNDEGAKGELQYIRDQRRSRT